MPVHLRLLPASQPRVDQDTLKALEVLLALAKDGRITGLAYVALQPGGKYSADAIGSVIEHPMLARGICATLQDYISGLVRPR